ncbi:hypothetical protein H2200_009436 [Cladophialophora chaetospira]|uniref:Zinc finger PHD-type domain-containing protein n=1 Tax=Cladophialophora chaetospira TaxID=386627 RepID=A0AA39CFQ2_9EURO|nr:hypothetical protein H2200_009436 [Cladophialophora chaetospira]
MAETLDPLVVDDDDSPRPARRSRRGSVAQDDRNSSKPNQHISETPVVLDEEDARSPQPTRRSRPVAPPAQKSSDAKSKRSRTQAPEANDEEEVQPRTSRRIRQAPVRFGDFVQLFPSEDDNIGDKAVDSDKPPSKRGAATPDKAPSPTVTVADDDDDASTDKADWLVHDPDYGLLTRASTPEPVSTPKPPRDVSEFLSGEKPVPDRFSMSDHVYIAAMLRVKDLVEEQEKKSKGRKRKRDDDDDDDDETKKWCSCKKPDDGRPMIECGDPACKVKWWHLDCLGDAEYELAEKWAILADYKARQQTRSPTPLPPLAAVNSQQATRSSLAASNDDDKTDNLALSPLPADDCEGDEFQPVESENIVERNKNADSEEIPESATRSPSNDNIHVQPPVDASDEAQKTLVAEGVIASHIQPGQAEGCAAVEGILTPEACSTAPAETATGTTVRPALLPPVPDAPIVPAFGISKVRGKALPVSINPVQLDTEPPTRTIIRPALLPALPDAPVQAEARRTTNGDNLLARNAKELPEPFGVSTVRGKALSMSINSAQRDTEPVTRKVVQPALLPPLPNPLIRALIEAEVCRRASSDNLLATDPTELAKPFDISKVRGKAIPVSIAPAQLDTEATKPLPRFSAEASVAPSYVPNNPPPRNPSPGPAAPLVEPLSPPQMTLRPISDQEALERSAQLWTTDKTKVTMRNNREFVMKYKNDEDLPSNPNSAMFHVCLPTGPGSACETFDINVETLAPSSFLIGTIVEKFRLEALEDGYMRLHNVSGEVVEACLSYLEGEYLFIKLPPSPLSDEFKTKLLQHTHFAHVLNIPRLMRAAMHALCTTVHSSPIDWVYDDAMIKLLDEFTFEGNPARRYLSSGGGSKIIKAEIGGVDFPDDEEGVHRICGFDHAQWRGLWTGEGKKFPSWPLSDKWLKERAALGEQATVSNEAC